jgi:hypothetical protein
MSARRAKTMRNEATVSEKALAGHVDEAAGICSLVTRVGRMTVNPETKYSYSELVVIIGMIEGSLP